MQRMHGAGWNFLTALMISAALVGGVFGACPEGDVYEDCRVDWHDLRFMAERWLDGAGSEADVIGGDGVNLRDFAMITAHWGEAGDATGLLEVTITPAEAVAAGARWQVNGGDWQNSGNMLTVPVGFHSLAFERLDGWTESADETVQVREGQTTRISREYRKQAGALRIRITPQAVIGLGAQWRIAGDVWRDSGETVVDLPVGLYAIEFRGIDPWMSPEVGVLDVVDALVTDHKAKYRHPIVINEFLASNSRSSFDPQGDDDDWLELYNRGSSAMNVAGMYLTDQRGEPRKWRIPNVSSLTTISAGGYLVIWADRDLGDNGSAASGLHADMELNAAGDDIHLFDSSGTVLIDSVEFADQDPNISYGRFPDGNDAWRLFGLPSPGTANFGIYDGFVAGVKFSHDRGLYNTSFTLTMACETEGAQIYFSVDGAEPGIMAGRFRTGLAYNAPFTITKTTCIRARAIKHGWKSSDTDAQSYIFLSNVLTQPSNPFGFPSTWGSQGADYEMDTEILYAHSNTMRDNLKSIPTMSLVVKTLDLFGSNGIYSNWSSRGSNWERPASVEIFGPDDPDGVQVNCGVRIYGGVGRREKKKTLRLLFKGIYGATKLRYPLFGKDEADEFDTIILRANFNDGYPWGGSDSQFIRDEWMRRAQRATGHPSATGNFVHLYINGLYWGLYNPTQRPDTAFSATYYPGDKDEWDGINSTQGINGSSKTEWNTLMGMCNSSLSNNDAYQRLQGNNPDGTNNPSYQDYLDAEQYINFLIPNFYGGNNDWKSHNWYAGRRRGPESGGWKGYTWDAEWVMGMRSGVSDNAVNDTTSSNYLLKPYTYLRNNSEFRLLFADSVHKAFFNGGFLYVDQSNPTWDPDFPWRNRPAAAYSALADEVEGAVICETARWGDVGGGSPHTIQQWRSVRDWVLTSYMRQRSANVLSQLRSANLYPNVSAPVFNINGSYRHGGHIFAGDSFSISGASGAVYYTTDGSDPRISQSSAIAGRMLVAQDAAKRAHIATEAVDDAWRGGGAFGDSSWTAVTGSPGGIGFDERPDYHPYMSLDVESEMKDKYTSCYVRIPFIVGSGELASFRTMTLRVQYDDGFVAYLNGNEIKRMLFTGTPKWDSDADGGHEASSAFESFDVSNRITYLRPGDNILAIHAMNSSKGSSDFLISAELSAGSTSTSGGDISPFAVRYGTPFEFSKSTHIKSRALSGSTWSALNEAIYAVGPVAENLRITEIMYHPKDTGDPDDPNEEFIELQNIGSETINLNMVRFTNGVDFTFGDIELGPGEYIVAVRDLAAFNARYPEFVGVVAGEYTGSLNNGGERIELEDAAGETILDFRYNDGWRRLTDGRGHSLTIIDVDEDFSFAWDSRLAAHWKLDDGAGTTATDSAGANDGILHGDPAWVEGLSEGALSFDGVDDHITFASLPALVSVNMTISAWVQLSNSPPPRNPIVMQHNTTNDGYRFEINEDKPTFSIVAHGRGTTVLVESSEPVSREQWYHIAATNDGSNLRIYVDGELKDVTSSVGYAGLDHQGHIGYDITSTRHFGGMLDDVRVYSLALSDDHIRTIADPTGRWGFKDSWRPSAYVGGSPGFDDSGIVPDPGAIVINEVLAHSHAEAADWIEFYNTTGEQIDIGGWYLSDSDAIPKKYKFADGTKIGAYSYLVLREDLNFGVQSSDPGRNMGFAFSENGDEAYLISGEGGVLTGYRTVEGFGASVTDVSFGRYFKGSTGNTNFVAMSAPTPGWANAYPRVGPIVINEIMYNPDWPAGGRYENDRYEYVELRNISAGPVKLYRDDKALPWKFTDGFDFVFPDAPGEVTIPAGDYVVVVRDLAAFNQRFPSVPPTKILGPYTGALSDSGEQVELSMPGDIDKFGRRHYIRIDRVSYSDGSHSQNVPGGVDLWPAEADAGGKSLVRLVGADYGNDPNNWDAADPSPGEQN